MRVAVPAFGRQPPASGSRRGGGRLSSRIVTILVCAAVLPVLVMTLLVGELAGTALLGSRLESLRQVAGDGVERIERFLDSVRGDVEALGGMGAASRSFDKTEKRDNALDTLADEARGLLMARDAYRSVILLDSRGTELLRVDRLGAQVLRRSAGQLTAHPEIAQDLLAPGIGKGQAYIKEIDLGQDAVGRVDLAAVLPVDDGAAVRRGSLLLLVAPIAVRAVLANDEEPEGINVLLSDPEGRLLSLPDARVTEEPASIGLFLGDGARAILGRQQGVVADINGYALAHRTVQWDALGERYWKIVAFMPRSIVLEPVQSLHLAMGGLALLLLGLSLLVGLLFTRRLVIAPFLNLLEAMRHFRDGELWARAVSQGGEMGELAATFNDMAAALAQNRLALESSIAERTEALKLEIAQRRRAQATLGDAVEAMQESFLVFDSEDRLVLFNNQVARVLGANADILKIGITFERFLRDLVNRRAITEAIGQEESWVAERLISHRKSNFHGEFHIAEGRWIEVREWRTADGGSVSITADITARKEMEARMAHSSKLMLLGELSAGLAHEITQPLNVIRLTSEATLARIDDHSVTLDEARGKLKVINEQADRLFDVIDYMQAFSRRESEKCEPFDLFASLRAACALLDEAFRQRRVVIRLDAPQEPCILLGHPRQMEQVVINLLTNARDAIVEMQGVQGGEITVTAWQNDHQAVVQVDDRGRGVPMANRKKIFEPFFSTKGTGKGTGLGLSISYGIVDGMGGGIEAGDAPGGGARFVVTLPVAETSCEGGLSSGPEAPQTAWAPTADTKPLHVLLVEDEVLAAEEMAGYLTRCGYRVSVAHGGVEGLAAFLADPAELVVTDVNMPGGGGRVLIDGLQNDYPHLPIIVVTGRSITKSEDLEEVGAGADVVLRKPIRLSELADHIERLLA